MPCRCQASDSLRKFTLATTVYDITWDLFAFAGYSTASEFNGGAIVVAFRGTDSHSLYNWVENMRYWKTDYDIPYPGSEGALVHTGTEECCAGLDNLARNGQRTKRPENSLQTDVRQSCIL